MNAILLIAASLVLPVAEVSMHPDDLKSTYPGRVVSIAQVDVVPQVSGEIREVAFANGASVQVGDVLYRVDSVKYEAAVKNAESKLAESKANAHYAEISYERHKKLLDTNAVSLDAVDNALSLRDSSRAAYAAAQADLVAAQDALNHCTIVAPIAGKLGSTVKTAGNYVTAGSLVLVSIVQHDPVRVAFSISNRELLELTGGVGRRAKDDVKIEITLADGSTYDGPCEIEYVENRADETTDTVMIYARCGNPSRKLVPGGTVAVTVMSRDGVMRPAIPPTAVLQDTQGPYVWVVGPDGAVQRRTVARGRLQGDWLFIEKGLSVGERVVADGAHRVRRGMTVEAAE